MDMNTWEEPQVTQEAGDQKQTEVKLLPIEEMEKMSHHALLEARSKAKTLEEQKHIAPYEHRAFAREYVEMNPVSGPIALAVGIPGYQVAKVTGLHGSRTGLQGKQVVEGFKGVGEGIVNAVKAPWQRLWNDTTTTLPQTVTPGSQKPWERSWGGAAVPPATASSAPAQEDGNFDGVFNRLMKQESGSRHTDKNGNLITSPVGAQGITQVMPKTGASPGFGVTPIQNNTEQEYVRFGKDYLKAMLKEFNGDYSKALAAYNYGPAGVKKAIEKGEKLGHSWVNFVPQETQDYIKKVVGKSNP
jgi:Transglycosylase SLT domain